MVNQDEDGVRVRKRRKEEFRYNYFMIFMKYPDHSSHCIYKELSLIYVPISFDKASYSYEIFIF